MRGQPNKHAVTIRIGDDLYRTVEARASVTGVPLSNVLVMLIQQQVDQLGALTTMSDMMAAYKAEHAKRQSLEAEREELMEH